MLISCALTHRAVLIELVTGVCVCVGGEGGGGGGSGGLRLADLCLLGNIQTMASLALGKLLLIM